MESFGGGAPAPEEQPVERAPGRGKSEYMLHQGRLAIEAFRHAHPAEAQKVAPERLPDVAGLYWVGEGWAAEFNRRAKELEAAGEHRLPNLEELHPNPDEGDKELLKLAS